MRVSVIISTYNSPEWLEKVLWGYEQQTHQDFEILIADDGSGQATRRLINGFKETSHLDIKHVWHEDIGYRRQTILNKTILQAGSEYIIFTDGDCIPRKDFIAIHIKHAERGYYLSGGYCKLSMKLSKQIDREDIESERCFDARWLQSYDEVGLSQRRKLFAKGYFADFLDFITTAKPTFNNCNSSGWKSDLIAVNGYDERMQYGGSDREIGERLINMGVRGKQIRHRAIVVHLDHARGYKTEESIRRNKAIRRNTRSQKIKWTHHGIRKPDSA